MTQMKSVGSGAARAERSLPRADGVDSSLVGSCINDKYRVVGLVAQGGMGKVYKAEQLPLGRTVAVKVLSIGPESDQGQEDSDQDQSTFRQRFFREASILAKMQHANVVTVYDYGRVETPETSTDQYFMAMEYLGGETLGERIKRTGAMGADDVMFLLKQLAQGLRAAHAAGVVHRDLKPSNVMLVKNMDGEELLKILDFGIIKVVASQDEERQDLTREGIFVGSPRYMAPEQVVGGKVDFRTDIYAFGIIAYQLCTGNTPFKGDNAVQTMMSHVNLPVPPMRAMGGTDAIPEWLERFVQRCLAKDPRERPQSAEEVLDFFRRGGSGFPSSQTLEGYAHSQRSAHESSARPKESTPSERAAAQIARTVAPPVSAGFGPTYASRSSVSPPGKRAAVIATVATALLAGFGIYVVSSRFSRPQTAPTIEVSASAAGAPASNRVQLTLESVPTGAEVWDGPVQLGQTPLHVEATREELAAAPKRYVVKLAGFEPYLLEQGASRESALRVVAQLVPASAVAPTTPANPVTTAAVVPLVTARPVAAVREPPRRPAASSAPATRPALDIEVLR